MLFILDKDTIRSTVLLFSIIYIFKNAEKITKVLHLTTAPGYVSKHQGFAVSVNCKCPYKKLST